LEGQDIDAEHQAVKEFSKTRLRKREMSNMLKRNHHNSTQRGSGIFKIASPIMNAFGRSTASTTADSNSLDLIRKEIAIMKKLDHPNLVSLIEVLDDPNDDLLYMVLEMCKKGPVMHVGFDAIADPYEPERCRLWFRDMILGIEYLHAQGIIHRDIKPDNCLVTHDDILKVVDFGVSEMFEHNTNMNTAKYAGSPAFMPPELCVAKHGEVSGRACDIWSMGVTLYCLAFGHIPFEKTSMLDLFEAIKGDTPHYPETCDPVLKDLLERLLEKDPTKRIEMDDIRVMLTLV
jgi:[calcium/calmodulin-dependent protein kinase] kinase